MKKEYINKIIDKHISLNNDEALIEKMKHEINGDKKSNEMYHAHVGAITALKMLKLEVNGEKKY